MHSHTRRHGLAALVLLCALGGCQTQPRAGDVARDEQGDPLGLAALLIRDGHYTRAAGVLGEVDPQREDLDLSRYHVLRGLVALHQADYDRARQALEAALQAGADQPMLGVYLAQAHHGAGDFAATVAALDACRQAWTAMPDVHRLAIHSRWQQGDHAGAFAALSLAQRLFPGAPDLAKQRVLYLLELGLHQAATEAGAVYLEAAGDSAEAYLTLGEALRRGGRPQDAAEVLEAARLRYPADTQALVALSHAHLDAQRPRAAAVVMEQAARLDPTFHADAAELFRRAGDEGRALFLNMQMQDQRAKVRQRLGLLLQRARLEQAAALEPRLSRLGLLDDEDVRYALAYACFRNGALNRAAGHLRGITRPELFRSATELRKAIEVERQRLEEEG